MPATIRPLGLSHGRTAADSAFHSASRRCSGIDSTSPSWSVGSAAAIAARSSLISGCVVDMCRGSVAYAHSRGLRRAARGWLRRRSRRPAARRRGTAARRARGRCPAPTLTPGPTTAPPPIVQSGPTCAPAATIAPRTVEPRPITTSSRITASAIVAPASIRTRSPSTTCGPTTAPGAITHAVADDGRSVELSVDRAVGAAREAVGVEALAHRGPHAAGEDVRRALQVALGRSDVDPVGRVVRVAVEPRADELRPHLALDRDVAARLDQVEHAALEHVRARR